MKLAKKVLAFLTVLAIAAALSSCEQRANGGEDAGSPRISPGERIAAAARESNAAGSPKSSAADLSVDIG